MSLAGLKAIAMLIARCCMLNILGVTLSEVANDMLVDTLVERQARMHVKSLTNTLAKKKKPALLDTLVTRLLEVEVKKSY